MQILTAGQNFTLSEPDGTLIEILPVSASSLLVVFGDSIEIAVNKKVMSLHFLLKQKNLPWIKELTPAYSSLGISYDLHLIKTGFNVEGLVFDWVKQTIAVFLEQPAEAVMGKSTTIEIPVCFDGIFRNDLPIMSKMLDLSIHKIIDIFLAKTYRVFMLGFLPGFTYMGEVDAQIAIARKAAPSPIKAGAVGIAGKQTGIYPLDSLGGWHILGHTQVRMFDAGNNPPNFLEAGNNVKFVQITDQEYIMMNNKIKN